MPRRGLLTCSCSSDCSGPTWRCWTASYLTNTRSASHSTRLRWTSLGCGGPCCRDRLCPPAPGTHVMKAWHESVPVRSDRSYECGRRCATAYEVDGSVVKEGFSDKCHGKAIERDAAFADSRTPRPLRMAMVAACSLTPSSSSRPCDCSLRPRLETTTSCGRTRVQ